MAFQININIDGQKVLDIMGASASMSIVSTGAEISYDSWIYSGSGTFLGFACIPNAIEPYTGLAVGDTITESGLQALPTMDWETETVYLYSVALIEPSNLSISYKGSTIKSLSSSDHFELTTAGKYLEDDLLFNIEFPTLDTSDATVLAGYMRSGKTAYGASGKITGNIPNFDGSVTVDSGEITDLTGTTWYFNETIEAITIYYINFTTLINLDILYNRLDCDSNGSGGHPPGAIIYWYGQGKESTSTTVYIPSPYGNGWTNEVYRTISITGGTDATNSDFIAWLQENATQVVS